jgi:hypothetical protein
MRRLSVLLALALVLPASAQTPAGLALYIGPVPNPDGLVTLVSKDFADSYADFRKAHIKARSTVITLVDDPLQADAILTVTRRGEVDNGTTIGPGVPPISFGATISSTQHLIPTLLARLTVRRATSEGADFSGVDAGESDRTKWSTQAERIYRQAAAWLIANQDQLISLRHPQ